MKTCLLCEENEVGKGLTWLCDKCFDWRVEEDETNTDDIHCIDSTETDWNN